MAEDLKTIQTVDLSPFKCMVMTIGELPSSFVESMTYYEALAWLDNYLENTLIPAVNNNAEAVKELQDLYVELHDYVENYFDNLDVQEEINNKLDAMAEEGTLQEIITSYIQANVAWTFDTVADMKASENLVNGSYAQTLGFYNVNDGGGALYKITNTGTADEISIIAVDNLKAHLVMANVMNSKQFGIIADGTENDTSRLQAMLDYCKGKVREINFIGSEFYTTNYLDLIEFKNTTFNFAANLHRASATSTSFGLRIIQCENCQFNNFSLSSARDKTEAAPSGHSRVSSLGSNIIGVMIYASSNLTFKNCKFSNTASDFFNQIYESTTLESNNIVIDGWYSRNSSLNLFVQRINNLTINNADLIPAPEMGDGDHHIYCSQYVKGVHITNSKFGKADNNFGCSINFNATGTGASDISCPKDLLVENCTFDLVERLIYQERLSNSIFINCKTTSYVAKKVFTSNDSSSIELINCDISGSFDGLSDSYRGNLNIEVKNCNINCSTETPTSQFIVFSYNATSYSPKLTIEGCKINYNNTFVYSEGHAVPTILIAHNKITLSKSNYWLSIRNNGGRVDVNNNIIINSLDTFPNLCYNSLDDNSHMNIYYNLIYGYSAFGNAGELPTINHGYNNIDS